MRESVFEATLPGQIADNVAPSHVILNLVDYDGCIGHQFALSEDATIDQKIRWLSTHEILITYLRTQIASTTPCRFIFGLGTCRQDYLSDLELNNNKNGSCFPSLLLLQEYFAKKYHYQLPVLFDSFMMADIYHKDAVKSVISSDKSFSNIYIKTPKDTHASAPVDEKEISLIYAHAHRAALLNPNTSIKINFFNAGENKIPLAIFFSQHTDLLPNNVELHVHFYNGLQLKHNPSIQGTGTIDKNYDWTTRMMAVIANVIQGPEHTKSPDYFLSDFSFLMLHPPTKIDLFNCFNTTEKKAAFLTAREIIQTWESRISRNGYNTARNFKKIYGVPAFICDRLNLIESIRNNRSLDHNENENNEFNPNQSQRFEPLENEDDTSYSHQPQISEEPTDSPREENNEPDDTDAEPENIMSPTNNSNAEPEETMSPINNNSVSSKTTDILILDTTHPNDIVTPTNTETISISGNKYALMPRITERVKSNQSNWFSCC